MEFNFKEYPLYEFKVNGRRVETLEDCRDWIAKECCSTDWKGFTYQNWPYELVKKYEAYALELHLYLSTENMLGE